jgi:hypothetical protein
MGDLRPNGGGMPPDDGGSHPERLPDFPPEWGPIIIPDDPAELAEEAEALRRELRQQGRRGRLRTALGLKSPGDPSSLGISFMIMAVAVFTTLISLFVVTWGRQPSPPLPTNSVTGPAPVPATGAATALADLVLPDPTGSAVNVRALLPAVILLIDGCDCTSLVQAVAAAAPAGVTVVPVGRTATPVTAARNNVRPLSDPDGQLHARYGAAPTTPGGADVIVVSRAGTVVATRSGVTSADQVSTDLTRAG